MEIKRVFDILDHLKEFGNKPDILSSKKNKQWFNYSTEDFYNNAYYVSSALIEMGLTPGDKACIISNNCPEWPFVDFGCQLAGIVSVPVFPTISAHDLTFILMHSEAKIVFVFNADLVKKVKAASEGSTVIQKIISFTEVPEAAYFGNFLQVGKEKFNDNKQKIEQIKSSIQEDGLFTILYTSGTTGTPKGVMLSHRNLVSNVLSSHGLAPFKQTWRALSFLPLNHILERMICNLYLYCGISIYYAEGLEKIADNLREVKPHIFITVPRLLERLYDKIIDKGEKLTGYKKKLFFWAVDIAENYELEGANGWWYEFKRSIADKLIFSKWREALGGNIVCVASGGAALQVRLSKIFTCAKIVTLEGYGLTETSPVIAVNNFKPHGIKFGTVGLVNENLEVKIAADGEIIVRGPSIMLGYYKNEEATKEVLTADGWFHTGDIGMFVDGKYLKITDRKKEIFKTSSGKYIAPLVIENMLKQSRFVEQCMVIGEGEKFASALIVPNFEYLQEWSKQNGIVFESNEKIIESEIVKKAVSQFVRDMNKNLAPYEQIKRQAMLTQNWTIEGGELTPKMSMKRKVIFQKNKSVIDKIFSSDSE